MRTLFLGLLWLIACVAALPLGAVGRPPTPESTRSSMGRGLPALPQGDDIVPWKTLADVGLGEERVRGTVRSVPKYGPDVRALDGQRIKVAGFMMPLEPTGDRQKRFLLTKLPPSCAFCLPGGPETMVLVEARSAVKFTYEPLVMAGRLELMRDDSTGVLYALKDATPNN